MVRSCIIREDILISDSWEDYELIDAGSGERLERWKDIILIRPEPQAIWKRSDHELWDKADAIYFRSSSGGGEWKYLDPEGIPDNWFINYKQLKFKVKPTGFKHTGLFPEQAVNWDFIIDKNRKDQVKTTLNLFGYTGGSSIAAAVGGSNVVHVDASKGAVNWCKENSHLSKVREDKVRYIVDDCMKFVERDIRREKNYDAIILDPPAFGRGINSEVWKLQDDLWDILVNVRKLLSDNKSYVILNTYTASISKTALHNIMSDVFSKQINSNSVLTIKETVLPFREGEMFMPCGITTRLQFK